MEQAGTARGSNNLQSGVCSDDDDEQQVSMDPASAVVEVHGLPHLAGGGLVLFVRVRGVVDVQAIRRDLAIQS